MSAVSYPRPRHPRLSTTTPIAEQFAQLDRMTPEERLAAMFAGELTYPQLGKWVSRWPDECPIVAGEFIWIAAFDEDKWPVDAPTPAESRRRRKER